MSGGAGGGAGGAGVLGGVALDEKTAEIKKNRRTRSK